MSIKMMMDLQPTLARLADTIIHNGVNEVPILNTFGRQLNFICGVPACMSLDEHVITLVPTVNGQSGRCGK
jgi:hypothetical protein